MENPRKEWYNMDFIETSGLSFSQLNETIRHAGKECRCLLYTSPSPRDTR